jgi:hypothetical protein
MAPHAVYIPSIRFSFSVGLLDKGERYIAPFPSIYRVPRVAVSSTQYCFFLPFYRIINENRALPLSVSHSSINPIIRQKESGARETNGAYVGFSFPYL